MGAFTTPIEVGHADGGETVHLEATVDLELLHTMIPRQVADRLKIPHQGTEEYETETGKWREYPLGAARVILRGREGLCPVTVSSDGRCGLGMTTLAVLGLIIDPVTGELEPTRGPGKDSLSEWPV